MRKRYIIGAGLLGLVVLFGSCGTPSQGPVAPSTAQAAPVAPSAAPTAPAPPTAPPAEPTGPQTSFGNGEWLVGQEVVPGTYRSTGPPANDLLKLCMVTITPAPKNSLGMDTSHEGPVRVDLVAGQTVHATGCEAFTKVS